MTTQKTKKKTSKKTNAKTVKTKAVSKKRVSQKEALVESVQASETVAQKIPLVTKEVVAQVKKDMKKQINIPNLLTLFCMFCIINLYKTCFLYLLCLFFRCTS